MYNRLMDITHDRKFERTDIWREGKWIDLWSVPHFLSGLSIGLGFFILRIDILGSIALVLVSLVAYEMWEAMVRIQETPTNRFMDVVVGMVGFLPAFFLFAPRLSEAPLVLTFVGVLAVDIVMSVFGWRASQKAAALEQQMRVRYAAEHAQFIKRSAKLRERFRRGRVRATKLLMAKDEMNRNA
jgi:hypothetical protein